MTMRRIRLVVLCLTAVVASSAVAASSASAHSLEGVCYAKKKGGEYSESACKASAPIKSGKPKGKFEWAELGTCYEEKGGEYTETACKTRAPSKKGKSKGKWEKAGRQPKGGHTQQCHPNPGTVHGLHEKGRLPNICDTRPFKVSTRACPGGMVTATSQGHTVTLTETPSGSGNFQGTFPPVEAVAGKGIITYKETCPGPPPYSREYVDDVYYDPSGTVVDRNHNDAPIVGATVTLLEDGTSTPVPARNHRYGRQ